MRIKTLCILLVFLGLQINAQNSKFGDVTISELKETKDEVFPEAPAKLLIRDIKYEFGSALYVYEKIKIYNSEGFKYSNWKINFNDIGSLKATVYNLENEKIIKTKVTKSSIFKEKVSENRSIRRIAFPNVKSGSILEIKYKVLDIGLRYINTQSVIPIEKLILEISNPYYLELNIIKNPLSDIKLDRAEKSHKIVYTGENIKALPDEVFVTNIDKYQGRINIEQVNNTGVNKLKKWGDVSKKYNERKWFNEESRPRNFYKDNLGKLISSETDKRIIAEKIYYFIQGYMTWNLYYGRGCDNVKKTYYDKEGNTGEINILLTSMLRKAGLNANPILISSISSGYISYPTIKGFDNALASVEINNEIFILDAARENAGFGELSYFFINGKGLIVYPDDTYKLVSTTPTKISKSIVMANVLLDIENNSISGTIKRRQDAYFAYRFRDEFQDLEEKDIIEKVEGEADNLSVSNIKISGIEENNKPIIISYNVKLDDVVEIINDKIYIAPLLYLGIEENIFIQEERNFPVNFKYPFVKNRIINIKIPEGYRVESIPSSKSFLLQNNIGSFEFKSSVKGQIIQNSYILKINHTLIPVKYYKGLQTMYSEFLKISKSKIVLSKTI